MAKKTNDSDLGLDKMTAQDMAMKLLELITVNRADEDQMRKILAAALNVFAESERSAS